MLFRSVVFAVAADAPTAFAGRLLVGIGAGFGWVGSLKIIADWFPAARFAQVSGLTLMLGLFGGLFAQGPLAAAIGAFGWRATVLAAAGIGVAVATMILAWLRDRRPPAEMPGERGLNLLAGLRSAAGNRQVWIASLHGLSVNAPVNGVIGLWGVPYLVAAYGLTRQDAAWAASVVVVGWALGSPLAGYLSDRLRRRRVTLIAGSGICALSLGAVVALPLPISVLWPLLLIYGLSSGVTVVAYAVARENMPASASGAAIGFSNMIAVFGIALLQGATGWLLDFAWDGRVVDGVRVYDAHAYAIALGFYPLLIGAGHVLAYALRETQTR